MIAPVASTEHFTRAPPRVALSCDAAKLVPAYLEELWIKSRDRSISKTMRDAQEAEYFTQHNKWKTIQANLAIAVSTLSGSKFWTSLCDALYDQWVCRSSTPPAQVEEVVCLCLGHLEDHASIYQLSLLILLLKKLNIRHEKCFIFDPCHSMQDIGILEHLGFTILKENTEARIHVRHMTLFYMPHGDYHLTNNVIETNSQSLDMLAILGNSLAWVCNPDTDKIGTCSQIGSVSRATHAEKVLALARETHLPDTLFNGMREHLATLELGAFEPLGKGPVDVLDCTLTTFPSQRQSRVKSHAEAPLLRSSL